MSHYPCDVCHGPLGRARRADVVAVGADEHLAALGDLPTDRTGHQLAEGLQVHCCSCDNPSVRGRFEGLTEFELRSGCVNFPFPTDVFVAPPIRSAVDLAAISG